MRGWFRSLRFKRRRPRQLTDAALREDFEAFLADAKTALAWGMTISEWRALTDFERAECRRTVTTAPGFKATA